MAERRAVIGRSRRRCVAACPRGRLYSNSPLARNTVPDGKASFGAGEGLTHLLRPDAVTYIIAGLNGHHSREARES
jgi:hypothetical protein